MPSNNPRTVPRRENATTWMVTAQAGNQIQNTQAGQTVVGVIIYFVTGKGEESSVFVPDNIYSNVKRVHDIIHTQAELVDRIGSLVQE